MKNLFIFCISIILLTANCVGQNALDKDTSKYNNRIPFIFKIQDKSPIEIYVSSIDPKSIQNIEISGKSEATDRLGERGKNGAVIITLKQDVKLLTIDNLYKKFLISTKDRELTAYLDSSIIYKPNFSIFEVKTIKSVAVYSENETGIKYINIISNNPPKKLKPGEVYIRGLASR